MKKIILALITVCFIQPTLAVEVDPEIAECQDPLENTDSKIICSEAAYKLTDKDSSSRSIKNIPFNTFDHISFNYPDPDTNVVYNYDRVVVSKSTGETLGYLNIFAAVNTEASFAVQFKVYYSLDGKLLAVYVSDLN